MSKQKMSLTQLEELFLKLFRIQKELRIFKIIIAIQLIILIILAILVILLDNLNAAEFELQRKVNIAQTSFNSELVDYIGGADVIFKYETSDGEIKYTREFGDTVCT